MSTFIKMSKNKKIITFLWFLAILACIKSIFTDFGYDNAYTIALSYRHLKGDRLFQEIWDTTQMSVFVTDLLMLVYYSLFHTFNCVAIYLQFCSAFIYGIVCRFCYRSLCLYTEKENASLVALFLFAFRVKQSVFLAYADQQILFSILLFSFLLRFFKNQSQKKWLILSALSLCLEILSYPSTIITFPVICIFLLQSTAERGRNLAVFSGTCVIAGVSYVTFFLVRAGVNTFFQTISFIISGDSHGSVIDVSTLMSSSYWYGFLYAALWLVFTCGIAFFLKKVTGKASCFYPIMGGILCFSELILLLTQKITELDWTCSFYIIPSFLIFLGSFSYNLLSEEQKRIWRLALSISFSSVIATFFFTNLSLITILAYNVLGGSVSIIALIRRTNELNTRYLVFFLCTLVIMHRGLVIWGYSNSSGKTMVYEIENYIRNGATKYILCDTKTANYNNEIMREFHENINPNESYLLINSWLYDPAILLINEGNICNPNVTDTPCYNETLLKYMEIYPSKTPSVIAVSQSVPVYSEEVRLWIEENYFPYIEGLFYRYYRKK